MNSDNRSPDLFRLLADQDEAQIFHLLNEQPALARSVNTFGDTLLHYAASDGNSELFNLLIQCGASVDSINQHGQTPLHLATFNGQEGLVAALLQRGADIEKRDRAGMTPLMHASISKAGNGEVIADLLLSNGAAIDLYSSVAMERVSDIQSLLRVDKSILSRTPFVNSLLRKAIIHGNPIIAELLLDYGLSASDDVEDGCPPLVFACLRSNIPLAIIRNILEHGADPNVEFQKNGRTAMAISKDNDRPDIVDLLREFGATC